MHLGPVGFGTLVRREIGQWWEEPRLEPIVVIEFGRQRPAQAALAGAPEVFADRALSEAQAARDGVLRQTGGMAEAQQLTKMAHGQSLGRHVGSSKDGATTHPRLKTVSGQTSPDR